MGDETQKPAPSLDATDRLLDAIGAVGAEVGALGKNVKELQYDTKIVQNSVRELGKDYARMEGKVDELVERVEVLERHDRRQDQGMDIARASEAKQNDEMAAMVIAIDETRKLAKQAITKIEDLKKASNDNATETKAAVTQEAQETSRAIAKVESGQKTLTLPTKVAAVFNAVLGLIYLLSEIMKALGKHH